jgi:opacity protein-like surface antigen
MIYPFKTETVKGKLTPYIIGGNCFDYAKVSSNLMYYPGTKITTSQSTSRYTTAVQLGLGTNYHVTNRMNLSLSAQFMEHIGKDIHAVIVDQYGNEVDSKSHYRDEGNHLNIEPSDDDLVLAGHLLITLSLNITLFDLAK